MLIKINTCLWSNKEDAFQYINDKRIIASYFYIWKWDICYVTLPKLSLQNIIDLILLTLYVLAEIVKHVAQKPWSSNFSSIPAHILHWCEFWLWQANLASWLDYRPASSLQTCLPILALSWRHLLSLDLLCSHCWDAEGLCWWELCPACFAAVSVPVHLSLHSSVRRDLFVVWSVVFVQQRHLDPLTLISLPVMRWQKQTGWSPVASLCRVQIWVCDSQSH